MPAEADGVQRDYYSEAAKNKSFTLNTSLLSDDLICLLINSKGEGGQHKQPVSLASRNTTSAVKNPPTASS